MDLAPSGLYAASLSIRGDGQHFMSLDNCIAAMKQTGLENVRSNIRKPLSGRAGRSSVPNVNSASLIPMPTCLIHGGAKPLHNKEDTHYHDRNRNLPVSNSTLISCPAAWTRTFNHSQNTQQVITQNTTQTNFQPFPACVIAHEHGDPWTSASRECCASMNRVNPCTQ